MGTMVDGVSANSKIDKTYCLSIKALYESFGEVLEYCTIMHTNDGSNEYFDLYKLSEDAIVCMDGEEVTVIEDYGTDLKFINMNGEYPVVFKLTLTEFKIAAFN